VSEVGEAAIGALTCKELLRAESKREEGKGRGTKGGRESQGDSQLSMKPNSGLAPLTLRS